MKATDFTGVPCIGVAEMTNVMTWEEASDLLNYCEQCPLRYECVSIIDPLSNWSDGIAGGYLFLNGRPLVRELYKIETNKRPYNDKQTLQRYLNAKNKNV